MNFPLGNLGDPKSDKTENNKRWIRDACKRHNIALTSVELDRVIGERKHFIVMTSGEVDEKTREHINTEASSFIQASLEFVSVPE